MVLESKAPDLYAKIEANEVELPEDSIVIMRDNTLPDRARLVVERCTWSEAYELGASPGGGVTIEQVDERIADFASNLTVVDMTEDYYTASQLNIQYPDKPARFKVVCPVIQQAYEKATDDMWFNYTVTMLDV